MTWNGHYSYDKRPCANPIIHGYIAQAQYALAPYSPPFVIHPVLAQCLTGMADRAAEERAKMKAALIQCDATDAQAEDVITTLQAELGIVTLNQY